jgi:hypothetical protein
VLVREFSMHRKEGKVTIHLSLNFLSADLATVQMLGYRYQFPNPQVL